MFVKVSIFECISLSHVPDSKYCFYYFYQTSIDELHVWYSQIGNSAQKNSTSYFNYQGTIKVSQLYLPSYFNYQGTIKVSQLWSFTLL